MKMAQEEMARDGMVFSCLDGQRQRYEYFGYTPAGSIHAFGCNEANVAHTLGRQWKTGLSVEKLAASDGALLDQIHAMHEAKGARMRRDRGRLFDILSSKKAQPFVITRDGSFEGYLVYKKKGEVVTEINLKDFSRLPEALGLFLRKQKRADISVVANPHEPEKIACLSGFAETYSLGGAYQFAIFDHARFADAFVKFKAGREKIREGSFVFQADDAELSVSSKVRLFAGKGGAGAEATDEAPALKMSGMEATRFLYYPTALTHPAIRESEFLQDLLPLPVFWECADGI